MKRAQHALAGVVAFKVRSMVWLLDSVWVKPSPILLTKSVLGLVISCREVEGVHGCVTDPVLGTVKLSKLLIVWPAGSPPNDSHRRS